MMAKLAQLLQSTLKYRGALGIAGLIVLVGLLVLLQILSLPIFTPIGAADTTGLLSLIVRSVFWLALTSVVVSGLAYVLPARLFVPVSKLEYAVAVFRMIDPIASPTAAINDRFEPLVGFPYYSRESDHPSFWPARVARDRDALQELYRAFYSRPDVTAALSAARAQSGDDSSVSVHGGADPLAAAVISARMFFNIHLNGDPAALTEGLGVPLAREFLAIEDARNQLREFLPNRIAILRLRNAGTRTIRDVTIEYEVAGYVYDTKVRAVAEGTSEPFLPFEHRLVIPKLLPGQSYDISIWYRYQSVNERAFPDKINFIQELTQGFTVSNIAAATGGKVVFDRGLLKSVQAYERLYDGDGRPSDNPEAALAELFKERAAAHEVAAEAFREEHLTAQDLTLDALGAFPIAESQVENVWIRFESPAAKRYRAVCVYEHPRGPYVLLSSEDRDRVDFVAVRTALAEALAGEPEEEVTDRSNDICSTIPVAAGFTRPAILKAFQDLEARGFRDMQVEKLHYRKTGKSGDADAAEDVA